MKALLLAAGLGTRLRAASDDLPKCMFEVGGKPVLQWNVEWLRDHGIRDLVINLHYRPETVCDHFGDGTGLGVRIEYSPEETLAGTAGALRVARSRLERSRFVVLYADNLINCDLVRMEELHRARGAVATVALYPRADLSASGVAILDASDRVLRFIEKPTDGVASHWVNAGLVLCEPEVIDHVPASVASDIGRDLFPNLIASRRTILGYRMGEGEWLYWIDTPGNLAATRAAFARKEWHV